jgi:hypothetical protein
MQLPLSLQDGCDSNCRMTAILIAGILLAVRKRSAAHGKRSPARWYGSGQIKKGMRKNITNKKSPFERAFPL